MRLRRLGQNPGPIDGLYGPLTAGAVERFQVARGLQVDGVVGPQTGARLLHHRSPHPDSRGSGKPGTADSDRPAGRSPAPGGHGAAPDKHPASPAGNGQAADRHPASPAGNGTAADRQPARPKVAPGWSTSAPPESGSSSSFASDIAPFLLAAAAGLLLLGAWALMRRRRRSRPAEGPREKAPSFERTSPGLNLGLLCAAVLAGFVIGAAAGALFATQAGPDDAAEATAKPLVTGHHNGGQAVVRRESR